MLKEQVKVIRRQFFFFHYQYTVITVSYICWQISPLTRVKPPTPQPTLFLIFILKPKGWRRDPRQDFSSSQVSLLHSKFNRYSSSSSLILFFIFFLFFFFLRALKLDWGGSIMFTSLFIIVIPFSTSSFLICVFLVPWSPPTTYIVMLPSIFKVSLSLLTIIPVTLFAPWLLSLLYKPSRDNCCFSVVAKRIYNCVGYCDSFFLFFCLDVSRFV